MTAARATGYLVGFLIFMCQAAPAIAASCESLMSVSLPHTTITSAKVIAAGKYPPPPPAPGAAAPATSPFADLPAFCSVTATSKPSSDSNIQIEVWLPDAATWNGKFRGTGKGGLAGGITVVPLARDLRLGYATAANNTGHEGDSSYLIGHPEQVIDFGYRASHEMTVVAKAVVKAYYGKAPAHSIISEGGGGTTAALNAAQRFPEDYDLVGIVGVAGHWTRFPFAQMYYWQAMHKDAASLIPPSQYPLLHRGALEACDELDGLKDGIIGNVERCKFDPVVIQCKGAASPDCLTAPQVEAARKIYQGPINSKTKQELYSPLYPGSELGWGRLAGGDVPWFITLEFFKYYVFQDPSWDYKTRPVNFDNDTKLADRPEIQVLNALNPDLTKFFARGGKMLMVEGWNDFDVPPKVAIDYYKNVLAKTGAKAVKESMRFFMVPGMAHTPGTGGAENFNYDAVSILEEWKRTGKAPEVLIVSHYRNGVEVGKRLVCQYPQVAMYKGSGNTEDPASFMCK